MLDPTLRQQVKATAPVLQAQGVALTTHFYARLFAGNPELLELFNLGHQRSGVQQQALAMAVAAYAKHIDEPQVLMPVLERVAARHVSLGIRQEHYAVVGRHLLASIGEVLGEAATPELLAAWAAAYGELAGLLAGMEQSLYAQAAAAEGGWTGWRTFRIQRRQPESDEITSFELRPADGGRVPGYRPGQYVSLRVLVPGLGYRQPRQYSLSDAPGKGCLRISVKRERGQADRPAGMVSGLLHDRVAPGDLIELSPPAGDFFLHEDRRTPVVLISAGVGVTPMMAMLEHLALTDRTRPVRWLHAARHAGAQAFGRRVRELAAQLQDALTWTVHEQAPSAQAGPGLDAVGRLELAGLAGTSWLPDGADHYLCGPAGFMAAQSRALRALGVEPRRIHTELFGTGGVAA